MHCVARQPRRQPRPTAEWNVRTRRMRRRSRCPPRCAIEIRVSCVAFSRKSNGGYDGRELYTSPAPARVTHAFVKTTYDRVGALESRAQEPPLSLELLVPRVECALVE